MTQGSSNLVQHLSRLLAPASAEAPSDRELLERFTLQHDEAAFTLLVQRHGPLVWGVCRRVLPVRQDAEDAFQAAFLILARKAGSIRKLDSVGSWLYGVAWRIALRSKTQAAARQRREGEGADAPPAASAADMTVRELHAALDEELARLPERLRGPVLLCYLEGETQEDAARQLGWSKATLRRRLARAIKLLRVRLTRRGLSFSALLVGALSQAHASATLPPALLSTTVQAARQFGLGEGISPALSPQAAALAEGGLHAMFLSKLKIATVVFMFCALLGASAGLWAQRQEKASPADAAAELAAKLTALQQARQPRTGTPIPTLPPAGDPDKLPGGAVARIGDLRWYQGNTFFCFNLAPDGKSLAVAQEDSTVRLLEVPSGKEIARLGTARGPIPRNRGTMQSYLTWSPDGQRLAFLHHNQQVIVWDTAAHKELCAIESDLQREIAAPFAFSPDGKLLAVAGNQKPPKLWSIEKNRELRTFEGHEGRVPLIAFGGNGKTVVTAGDDGLIRLWDMTEGAQAKIISGHRSSIAGLAVSPDGKVLASASADGTIRTWELATGKQQHLIEVAVPAQGLPEFAQFLTFTDDGKTIALVRGDRSVQCWDVATGREQAGFRFPHADPVMAQVSHLVLSRDGKLVVAGTTFGRLQLWERASSTLLEPAPGHQYPVAVVIYSPDGKYLVTGSHDHTLRVWDAVTGKEVRRLVGHSGGITAAAFSADGKVLATASSSPNDRSISLWDIGTGQEVRTCRLPSGMIEPEAPLRNPGVGIAALAYCPNGKRLASLLTSGACLFWDPATGKQLHRSQGPLRSVGYSPDGKYFVGIGSNGDFQVYDANTGDAIGQPGDVEKAVPAIKPPLRAGAGGMSGRVRQYVGLAFTPDGKTAVVGGADQVLHFIDITSRREVRQIGDGSRDNVPRVPGAPSSSGGGAGMSGTSRTTTLAPRPPALFTPDGRLAVLVSPQHGLRVFEVWSGNERYHLDSDDDTTLHYALSPNGTRVATAHWNGTVTLWDIDDLQRAKKTQLSDKDRQGHWEVLLDADAEKAYAAILALLGDPAGTVKYLGEHLTPAVGPNEKQIGQFIEDLDSNEFAARKRAAQQLENAGELARLALRKKLDSKPSLDLTRRIDGIIEKLESRAFTGEQLRMLRAVEVLEKLGTPEARELLRKLADGVGTLLTIEARAALGRLAKR